MSAYLAAIVAAVGGLIFSIWWTFKIYSRHLKAMEQAESEARFIVHSCPDAVLLINSEGTIESCNPATEKIFGYERDRIIKQRISKLIPQRHFLLDVTTLGRKNFIAVGERRNTVRFPVEIAVSEAQNEGKRHFIVLIHDASERRYSDETVHQISLSISSSAGVEYVRMLAQQLSMALQNDYAFIVEVESESNAEFCSVTMAEEGRLRSKTNYSLAGTAFAKALETGFMAIPKGACEQFPNDSLLATLKAESFIATPLLDHMDRKMGLIGIIGCAPATQIGIARQTLQIFANRAATEVKRKQEVEGLTAIRDSAQREKERYEKTLAAEQELLAVTLRSIREGFITTDNDGRVVMVNPVAEQLTGWTQTEATDRPVREVLQLTTVQGNRALNPLRDFLDLPLHIISRNGTQKRVEVSIAPIRAQGDIKLGFVLVLRDVTEKQLIEEERQKADKFDSIGLAAGGIAHDFNNLLTAVIGNLSLSLQSAKGEVRDRVEASRNAALRAQDLARQLLTFSKSGPPIRHTTSILQLVSDTVGFTLSGTNIRSCLTLSDDLWPAAVDAGQISQVISNLVINAMQVMERGGTLYVVGENLVLDEETAPPILKPGKYVRISIRDEGPGVPEEIQKKIFDPYFTTKPNGNGLGLATSYSIIKNHEGYICVDSPPGEGATFCFYLPASEEKVEHMIQIPQLPMRHHGRILVLDDEEVICELISYTLSSIGYSVAVSQDARSALQLYQKGIDTGQPFDLVIMDLTIPGGMGGREAIKELKKIDPGAKALVSSGYGNDPIMLNCKEHGFCGAIPKPFDLAQLEIAVQTALAAEM